MHREPAAPYELSWVDRRLLYHGLTAELKRRQAGSAARFTFTLLELLSYGFPTVLGLAFLGNALLARGGLGAAYVPVKTTVAWLGALILPMLGLLVAMLASNAGLAVSAYRQWVLGRQLIALRLVDEAFRRPRAGRWAGRLKWLVLLPPLGLLALAVRGLLGWGGAVRNAEAGSGWAETLLALGVAVGLPATVFLADRILRRLRARLEYFAEVASALRRIEAPTTSSGGAILSPEEVDRIAAVQWARLLRESAEAVRSRPRVARRGYAVSKDDAAAAVLHGVDTGDRLRIERALEDLAAMVEKGYGIPVGAFGVIEVEGTAWQVTYEVDRGTRTIVVAAVRRREDATTPRMDATP